MPRIRKVDAPVADNTGYIPAVTIKVVRERGIDDIAKITSPYDAVSTLRGMIGDSDQEKLVVLILDTKNRIIAAHHVYTSTLNSSMVRVSEVLRMAIIYNAAGIIISHNHPSGDPSPSPEDVLVTRNIKDCAKMFDIELLDHIIIGEYNRYCSMRERGLGF